MSGTTVWPARSCPRNTRSGEVHPLFRSSDRGQTGDGRPNVRRRWVQPSLSGASLVRIKPSSHVAAIDFRVIVAWVASPAHRRRASAHQAAREAIRAKAMEPRHDDEHRKGRLVTDHHPEDDIAFQGDPMRDIDIIDSLLGSSWEKWIFGDLLTPRAVGYVRRGEFHADVFFFRAADDAVAYRALVPANSDAFEAHIIVGYWVGWIQSVFLAITGLALPPSDVRDPEAIPGACRPPVGPRILSRPAT